MWSQRKRLAPPTEEEAGDKGDRSEAEEAVDEKEMGSEGASVKSAHAVTARTTDLEGNLVVH